LSHAVPPNNFHSSYCHFISRTPIRFSVSVNSLFGLGMGASPLLFWLEKYGCNVCSAKQALALQLFDLGRATYPKMF